VANVLARKGVKLEDYTAEYIRDPKVGRLAARAKVVGNMSANKVWEAEVSVKMNDGRILSAHVDTLKGDPLEKRITKEEIEAKFWTNIAFSNIISKEKAEKALNMLNELEAVEDVASIVKLLTE